MSLPRNVMSRNEKNRKKKHLTNKIRTIDSAIEDLCKANSLGNNEVIRQCKFSDINGTVTLLQHKNIYTNFRHGITVVETEKIIPSNVIYDVVTIRNEKQKRDWEKNIKEMQELEKLNAEIAASEKSIKEALKNKRSKSDLNDSESDDSEIDIKTDENVLNPGPTPCSSPTTSRIDNKHQTDNQSQTGNRHVRKFRTGLKKLKPERVTDIAYFEILPETTEMVVEVTESYVIKIPTTPERYYHIFFGELVVKSELLNKIDPQRDVEQNLREQSEFLERIKAMDNVKVREVARDDDGDVEQLSDKNDGIIEQNTDINNNPVESI